MQDYQTVSTQKRLMVGDLPKSGNRDEIKFVYK